MNDKKIIVLTPVKNEGRILSAFLEATLRFADFVVLAYQPSTDETLEIARRYERVIIVETGTEQFAEKLRAELLVREARSRFGNDCILLALDADEFLILSNEKASLQILRNLAPGSSIEFEIVDILPGAVNVLRQGGYKCLAYADDGCEFEASVIHTQRVPKSTKSRIRRLPDLPVLHLNLMWPKLNRAKRRMYAVLEALHNTNPWHLRLLNYRRENNWIEGGVISDLPEPWRNELQGLPINPLELDEIPPFWQDYDVLRLFARYGVRRFWMEDVWDCDWQYILETAPDDVKVLFKDKNFTPPPFFVEILLSLAKPVLLALRSLKRSNVNS